MDPVEILMHWLAKNYSKLILLAVVLIVAALIDKVSGRGTWASNPWVMAYEFELVK